MTDTNMVALSAPLSNAREYTCFVESFPRLDEVEERKLAIRLQRDNDLEAAWRLVTSNLRHVVSIARGYTGYGLPLEDLIQEGNIGLMNAVRRFDPKRGARLMAYAVHWIRAEIHEFIMKNWRIVKLATTKAKRKLFYKLRSTKKHLDWLNRSEAEAIARDLGVEADDVMDMDASLYLPDQSFDGTDIVSANETRAPKSYVADSGMAPDFWVVEGQFFDCAVSALREALSTLDARSRDIIESRWLAEDDVKLSLQTLGERYGVSAERIRQLEAAAVKHLRQKLVPQLGVDQCNVEIPRQHSLLAV